MTGTYAVIEIDQFIRQLKQNIDLEHVVLLGAGASKSSGVPTANECIWMWKEQLYKSSNAMELGAKIGDEISRDAIQAWLDKSGMHPPKGDALEYVHYAEKVYLNNEARRAFFENLFEGKQPGLGYKILTLFAKKGAFKIIMTTNFDGLVTKVLQSESVNVKEITIETSGLIHKPMPKKSVYSVALHGDYKYDALKNTGSELDNQSDDFKHALNRHLYNKHLIVAGYSGRDNSLMDALESAYKEKGGGSIFWCNRSNKISPEVDAFLKKISSFGRDAYLVVSGDFDDSFIKMGRYCFHDDKVYSDVMDGFSVFKGIEDGKVIAGYVEVEDVIPLDKVKVENQIDLSSYDAKYLEVLILANIFGSWDEGEADLSVVGSFSLNFSDWDRDLRELLHYENPLVCFSNGRVWSVNHRFVLWNLLKERIFDAHLDKIKEAAVKVLSEVDPKFELELDQRYAASIFGKKLRFSNSLREGLAEALVWLGINGDSLSNCSPDKRRFIALSALRELFSNASWQLWGSLNHLLPTLAEASPDEFLNSVEAALRKNPSPFDDLFRQEGDGVTGANHMTGLYWALEGLAWDEAYLVRVCVMFAELAEHDPGGRWANRPANSIITILLSWHPQTLAPIEKRVAAVRAVRKDSPQIAWKVLLSLLPNSHQSTSGSHKPKWRNPLPDDWKPSVTNGEYWEQVNQYAAIAVEMACQDLTRSRELVENLDNLPEASFNVFLEYLSSQAVIGLPEVERKILWDKLTAFANKHRRFSESNWALPPAVVDRLEAVADLLKPESSSYLYERLFIDSDFDLYDENGDWQSEEKKLADKRISAIQDIFNGGGINSVIEFSKNVESSRKVGYSLGRLGLDGVDDFLLPDFLNDPDVSGQGFISNYIWGRYHNAGWDWVDSFDISLWCVDQKVKFLIYLPFDNQVWQRASQWLGSEEGMYWSQANVNPYATDDDLVPAIDKLLAFGRPVSVIDCLYCMTHKKLPLDIARAIKALSMAVESPEEKNTYGFTHAVDLIKALQNDTNTSFDDLCLIEWKYLNLLKNGNDAKPKYLHKRLSSDPQFFIEMISYVYRSDTDMKEGVEPDEEKRQIATNAWHLLYEWARTPGIQDDGSFSASMFSEWFKQVKDLAVSAGRLDVALSEIGKVLRYTPQDPDGFWIHKSVLDVLNGRDGDPVRDGFRSEVFNSRGVYTVDPTGKPERSLAEEWRKKANAVELLGYARFSAELNKIADYYERDAERVIAEYRNDG